MAILISSSTANLHYAITRAIRGIYFVGVFVARMHWNRTLVLTQVQQRPIRVLGQRVVFNSDVVVVVIFHSARAILQNKEKKADS